MFGKPKKKKTNKKLAVAEKTKSAKPELSPKVAEANRLREACRQARQNADKTFNDFFEGKATAEMLKKADSKNDLCKFAYWNYVHKNFTANEIEKALNAASGPKPKGDFLSNLEEIMRAKQKSRKTKSTRKSAKAPRKTGTRK